MLATADKGAASGQQAKLTQVLLFASDKCSNHWSSRYFKEQLPLSSILEERKIAPQLADVFDKDGSRLERISEISGMPIFLEHGYCSSWEWWPFTQQVEKLAKKSALAEDKTFLSFLYGFSERAYRFKTFNSLDKDSLALAVFGHATASYELIGERGTIYRQEKWFAQLLGRCDLSAMQKTMNLLLHLNGLLIQVDEIRQRLDSLADPASGEAAKEIRNARMGLQGATYSLLDYLQVNYGLVFIPQDKVEAYTQKFNPIVFEYLYHTTPSFYSPTHSDTVAFHFGIPFFPLSSANKDDTMYMHEHDSVLCALNWLGNAMTNSDFNMAIDRIKYSNQAVRDELHSAPIDFAEQLHSYCRLLFPNSIYLRVINTRDWSFPTFRFDINLKAEFENLLSLRGNELAPEVLRDIHLTLKIIDARRKLYDSYSKFDSHNPGADATGFWKSASDSYNENIAEKKKVKGREYLYHALSPFDSAVEQVSLELSDHPGKKKFSKSMNKLGIEKIIGYRLPE